MVWKWTEGWKKCCGSTRFAKEMEAAGPFSDILHALRTARHVWLNMVDVNGWFEAFDARPPIGGSTAPAISVSEFFYSKWSELEQSKATSTVTNTTLEKRYNNRPIVELENAAHEEMKIIELRIQRLIATTDMSATTTVLASADPVTIAGGI